MEVERIASNEVTVRPIEPDERFPSPGGVPDEPPWYDDVFGP